MEKKYVGKYITILFNMLLVNILLVTSFVCTCNKLSSFCIDLKGCGYINSLRDDDLSYDQKKRIVARWSSMLETGLIVHELTHQVFFILEKNLFSKTFSKFLVDCKSTMFINFCSSKDSTIVESCLSVSHLYNGNDKKCFGDVSVNFLSNYGHEEARIINLNAISACTGAPYAIGESNECLKKYEEECLKKEYQSFHLKFLIQVLIEVATLTVFEKRSVHEDIFEKVRNKLKDGNFSIVEKNIFESNIPESTQYFLENYLKKNNEFLHIVAQLSQTIAKLNALLYLFASFCCEKDSENGKKITHKIGPEKKKIELNAFNELTPDTVITCIFQLVESEKIDKGERALKEYKKIDDISAFFSGLLEEFSYYYDKETMSKSIFFRFRENSLETIFSKEVERCSLLVENVVKDLTTRNDLKMNKRSLCQIF